jgi:hypothetical protein
VRRGRWGLRDVHDEAWWWWRRGRFTHGLERFVVVELATLLEQTVVALVGQIGGHFLGETGAAIGLGTDQDGTGHLLDPRDVRGLETLATVGRGHRGVLERTASRHVVDLDLRLGRVHVAEVLDEALGLRVELQRQREGPGFDVGVLLEVDLLAVLAGEARHADGESEKGREEDRSVQGHGGLLNSEAMAILGHLRTERDKRYERSRKATHGTSILGCSQVYLTGSYITSL